VNNGKVYLKAIVLSFVRLLLMNINTSMMFYWSFIGDHYVHFNFWGGALAASSLVSSLVSFSVSSSFSSLLGFFSLGYRYGFTTIVLKLVGPLGSYTLYISPLIPSNLNGLVYLLLYLVLPLRHISTSKLRGRLWIVVIDRPFY